MGDKGETVYMVLSGLPGDRCLRMEPRRSTAIVTVVEGDGWGEMEVMERMAAGEMHGRDSVIYTWPTTEDGSGARRGR